MIFLFPTRHFLINQGLFAAFIIFCMNLFCGTAAISSVSVGCIVALIPCIVFYELFFTKEVKESTKVVKRFYLAAIIKFLLLIALFIVAAKLPMLDSKKFFYAFVLMQVFCLGGNLLFLRSKFIK